MIQRAAAQEQDDRLAVVEWFPAGSCENLFAVDIEVHILGARDLPGGTKTVFEIHFDIPDIFKAH